MALNYCWNNSVSCMVSSEQLFLTSTKSVIVSVSIFLNVIVLISVCCSSRLHTFSHAFLASLAVSDVIFAIAYGIPTAWILFDAYKHRLLDKLFDLDCSCLYLVSVSSICSRCCHFLISVERWLYIARPFLHQRVVTIKSLICSLVFVWIISTISGI